MKTLKILLLILLPLSGFGQYFERGTQHFPAQQNIGQVLFREYVYCVYRLPEVDPGFHRDTLNTNPDYIHALYERNRIPFWSHLKADAVQFKRRSFTLSAAFETITSADTNDLKNYVFMLSSDGKCPKEGCYIEGIRKQYKRAGTYDMIDLKAVAAKNFSRVPHRIIRDSLFVFKYIPIETDARLQTICKDSLMPLVKIKGNGAAYANTTGMLRSWSGDCVITRPSVHVPVLYKPFKKYYIKRLQKKQKVYRADTVGNFRYNEPFSININNKKNQSLHLGHAMFKVQDDVFERLRLGKRLCLFNYSNFSYEPLLQANMQGHDTSLPKDTVKFLLYNLSLDAVRIKGFSHPVLSSGIVSPAVLVPGKISVIKIGIDMTRKKLKLNKWHRFSLKVKTDKGSFRMKYSIWVYKDAVNSVY